MNKIEFAQNIIVLGSGAIAKATLPLIREHFNITPEQIRVLTKNESDRSFTNDFGFLFTHIELTPQNYEEIFNSLINEGDLVVNLTAEVSSIDLTRYCSKHGILYIDTCIELWADETTPDNKTYDEREMLLKLKQELPKGTPTSLSSMGANPGVVSLLTKRLLIKISETLNLEQAPPRTQTEWAALAEQLTVRVIHVNERDTQYVSKTFSEHQFVSTWSPEAMIMESIEVSEMSFGTHEQNLPSDAHYSGQKNTRAAHFDRSGKDVQVATWLPLAGVQKGMILNHNEPMSIAELYSRDGENGTYSPTVCFVYHPSDQTMESLQNLTIENHDDLERVLLLNDIEGGRDELGVFIMTEEHGAFWLGSRLDIDTARSMNPASSATSLQVAAGVVAGMCWIVNHTNEGVIEPEDIEDHDLPLNVAEKYWDGYVFAQSDWNPNDPTLQFINFEQLPVQE